MKNVARIALYLFITLLVALTSGLLYLRHCEWCPDKGAFSASQSLARMGRTLCTTHPGYFHVETKPNPF